MFSLQDLLGHEKGNEALTEISQNVGAEPSAVQSVIQTALPTILGGLANNAATPQGAESLNTALEQDHNGGILDNLGGLGGMIFGGGQQAAPPRQADGGGILDHILGGSQPEVVEDVSAKTGIGSGQVMQILMMLAPIVMGYLGKQKQQQNVGPDGLGGLLGGLLGGASGGAGGGGLSNMLDRDGDGSSMDDVAGMAMDYLRNK